MFLGNCQFKLVDWSSNMSLYRTLLAWIDLYGARLQSKHGNCNKSINTLQQLAIKSQYQDAFAWLAKAC